ncbi:MAG: DUF1512 family protein [Candidatus Aenigmatarchaeota archaeon]
MIDVLMAQLGNGDWTSTLLWILIFMVFIFFGPRLMVTQTIWKLERDVARFEDMATKAKSIVVKRVSARPSKELKTNIGNFMDFFAIPPVATDPYGVIKKIDLVVKQSDQRFRYFVKQIAPRMSKNEQADLKNALAGAMTTHQIAKIVRHYLELIKKYKIFQLAILLQMQIPLIERLAKAALGATQAFADEMPIGDGIGPLVVASMIPAKARVKVYEEEEVAVARTKIAGRKVWIAKASGPGAKTSYPGKFLKKFIKRNRINRIITVDAALRLEGEKAGSVAEGVGIAMGGVGVERYEIEEIAVAKNLPIDAVAIKVNEEEALNAMVKEVVDAVPNAVELVDRAVRRAGKRESILIFGVGNTCGVGNNAKAAKEAEAKIRKYIKKKEKEKEKKKKK